MILYLLGGPIYINGESDLNHMNICALVLEHWCHNISQPLFHTREIFMNINILSKEKMDQKLGM